MALLEGQREIDEVILFPRRRWTQGLKSGKGLWRLAGEVKAFVSELKKKEFDVTLDFHGILKSGLVSYFSGAPRRIGFDRKSSKEGNVLLFECEGGSFDGENESIRTKPLSSEGTGD